MTFLKNKTLKINLSSCRQNIGRTTDYPFLHSFKAQNTIAKGLVEDTYESR
jgi:hypothetical protein